MDDSLLSKASSSFYPLAYFTDDYDLNIPISSSKLFFSNEPPSFSCSFKLLSWFWLLYEPGYIYYFYYYCISWNLKVILSIGEFFWMVLAPSPAMAPDLEFYGYNTSEKLSSSWDKRGLPILPLAKSMVAFIPESPCILPRVTTYYAILCLLL